MDLCWHWCRFEELGLPGLYEVLALRQQVFVVEQRCAYLDVDGLDPFSWHLCGRDPQGRLSAYLRLVDPGRKFAVPSIGRVITTPAVRGTGAGRALMAEGVAGHDRLHPGQANRIGAQAHLQAFYRSFGFEPVGEPYDEDGILHIDMVRAHPLRPSAAPFEGATPAAGPSPIRGVPLGSDVVHAPDGALGERHDP